MLAQELWMQFDVSWLVDSVDVSESGSNGEIWGDRNESSIDVVNVFWLSVEGVVVDIFVVDTIFFTASNANFLHLSA